jgi:hypothetical protein
VTRVSGFASLARLDSWALASLRSSDWEGEAPAEPQRTVVCHWLRQCRKMPLGLSTGRASGARLPTSYVSLVRPLVLDVLGADAVGNCPVAKKGVRVGGG